MSNFYQRVANEARRFTGEVEQSVFLEIFDKINSSEII